MLGAGLPAGVIQRFLDRLESFGRPESDSWDRPLTAAEVAELVLLLEDQDVCHCEGLLKELLRDIAARGEIPEKELRTWLPLGGARRETESEDALDG